MSDEVFESIKLAELERKLANEVYLKESRCNLREFVVNFLKRSKSEKAIQTNDFVDKLIKTLSTEVYKLVEEHDDVVSKYVETIAKFNTLNQGNNQSKKMPQQIIDVEQTTDSAIVEFQKDEELFNRQKTLCEEIILIIKKLEKQLNDCDDVVAKQMLEDVVEELKKLLEEKQAELKPLEEKMKASDSIATGAVSDVLDALHDYKNGVWSPE